MEKKPEVKEIPEIDPLNNDNLPPKFVPVVFKTVEVVVSIFQAKTLDFVKKGIAVEKPSIEKPKAA